MEIIGVDHVILPTAHLAGAAGRWQALGLQLTPPMRHAGASTENSVFFVGGPSTECYVELLAVHDRALAADEGRHDLLAAVDRGGLYRLMLQVSSADEAVAMLASRGVETTTRSVRRDDGSLIGSVVEPTGDTAAGCPFALIEYEGGAAARRQRHQVAGLFDHDFPLLRLDHLAMIVHDVEGPCRFWETVLGLPTTGRVTGRGMDIRQVRVGDVTVELIGPADADSPVHQRPEGLVSVTAFEVADLDQAVALARSRGFDLPDPAPGVLPASRVSTITPDQLGGLALQLIQFV